MFISLYSFTNSILNCKFYLWEVNIFFLTTTKNIEKIDLEINIKGVIILYELFKII